MSRQVVSLAALREREALAAHGAAELATAERDVTNLERDLDQARRALGAGRAEGGDIRAASRTVDALVVRLEQARARYLAHASAPHNARAHQQAVTPPGPQEPPPLPDFGGYDLRPDPLGTQTPVQFLEALRQYRIWAGEPSYRKMAKRSGQVFAASTLCTALGRNDLPRLPMVQAIIAGCAGSDEDQQRFATAWRHIRLGTPCGGALSQPGLRVVPRPPELAESD